MMGSTSSFGKSLYLSVYTIRIWMVYLREAYMYSELSNLYSSVSWTVLFTVQFILLQSFLLADLDYNGNIWVGLKPP